MTEKTAKIMSNDYARLAIQKSLDWKAGKLDDTDEVTLGNLQKKFHDTCQKMHVGAAVEEMLWESMVPELRNPVLAQFCQDAEAMHSEFFARWMWLIKNRQIAVACEPSSNYCEDLHGKLREMPVEDPMHAWVEDPVFQFLAYRNQNTAELLNGRQNILFLGAGMLPELRHTDYTEKAWNKDQRIWACDADPTIEIEKHLPKKVAEIVSYEHTDIVTMLGEMVKEKRLADFDVVIADGVLSYCIEKMGVLIATSLQLLRQGGVMQFDLQLAHETLVRNKFLFGWTAGGSFKLSESVEVAEQIIAHTCAEINVDLSQVAFNAPSINGEKIGVICRITKA